MTHKIFRKCLTFCLLIVFLLAAVQFDFSKDTAAQELQEPLLRPVEFQKFDREELTSRLSQPTLSSLSDIDVIQKETDQTSVESDALISLFYYPLADYHIAPVINSPYRSLDNQIIDVDNDGRVDTIYFRGDNVEIFFQDEKGMFAGPVIVTMPNIDNSDIHDPMWTVGDLNNDGLLEFIYVFLELDNYPNNKQGFQVNYQDTPRKFDSQLFIPTTIWSIGGKQIVAVDLNGDSNMDVGYLRKSWVTNVASEDYEWEFAINDGEGGFTEGQIAGRTDGLNGSSEVVKIMEYKGQPAIGYQWWERDESAGSATYFVAIDHLKDGVFQRLQTFEFDDYTEDFKFEDLNQDGVNEFVTTLYVDDELNPAVKTQIQIYSETVEGKFENPIYLDAHNDKYAAKIAFADANQDGNQDIIVRNMGSHEMFSVYLLNGEMHLIERHDVRLVSNEYGGSTSYDRLNFVANDVNGDGFPDLITGNDVYLHNKLLHQAYLSYLGRELTIYREYFDDFENPNSGWPIFNNEVVEYRYVDGEYSILNKSERFLGLALIDHIAKDYHLKAQGRMYGGSRGGYGLLFEATDDLSYFKAVVVFPNFDVVWLIDVDPAGNLRILHERRGVEFTPGHAIDLEVRRLSSGSLQVLVNDSTEIWSSADTSIENHRVGLITLPLDDGFEARFDNFSLELPGQ